MEAILGNLQGAKHGMEIAPRVARRPVIGHHYVPDFLHSLTASHDPYGRQSQSFLEHFRGGSREGANDHSANLGEMGDDCGIGHQVAIEIDGL